ncbi:MAG: hypothetical protein JXR70_08350 [Spirochaetales bacterium]|nr:hypothetical protein [Spirochaetales bacterium]
MADPAVIITSVKKQILKIMISPAYYFTLFFSLLLSVLIIHFFLLAIGPAGFNAQANIFFNTIDSSLSFIFGHTFMTHLFAEGPFAFVLIVAVFPVLIFLIIDSLTQFDLMYLRSGKKVEFYDFIILVLNYFLLSLLTLGILYGFFLLASVLTNLVLGYIFYVELLSAFLAFISFISYVFLIYILCQSKKKCIFITIFVLMFFLVFAIIDFMLIDGIFKSIFNLINSIFQWLNPINYFCQFITSSYYDHSVSQVVYFVLSMVLIVFVNLLTFFVINMNQKRKLNEN